eukprot:7731650-Alexandrium_andersonii.AAC.2
MVPAPAAASGRNVVAPPAGWSNSARAVVGCSPSHWDVSVCSHIPLEWLSDPMGTLVVKSGAVE